MAAQRATPPSSPPSTYYTASWGSPYDRLPSGSANRTVGFDVSDRSVRSLHLDSVLASDDSFLSFHELSNPHTPVSLDSPTSPSLRAAATGQVGAEHESERGNWWSDGSADEEDRSSKDNPKSWLSSEGTHHEEEPETPTLQRVAPPLRRHRSRLSNQTLKQIDFWTYFRDVPNRPDAAMEDSRFAATPSEEKTQPIYIQTPVAPVQAERPPSPSPVVDKPLPPAPQRMVSEYPKKDTFDFEPSTPVVAKKVDLEWQRTQYPKKRVAVKNRTWIIAIPRDETRGKDGGPPNPVTSEEMESKIAGLEKEGYDTRGFGHRILNRDDDTSGHGQNKSIYPSPAELWSEYMHRQFRVSIPDKAKWEAYVDGLAEAKLRALGVFSGDDEVLLSQSPATLPMSRQSSQYPPLPFSPPLPTSSAASNGNQHGSSLFSPGFMPGSTNPSSQVGSVASPVSSQNMHGSFHMPRQSISFTGSDGQYGSPYQFNPAQGISPINGVWSPQQQLQSQQALARGGSPAAMQPLQNMGSVLGSGSPFEGQPPMDLMMNQVRQQQLQNQLMQQQIQAVQQAVSARQSPRLEEVRETEEEHQQTSLPPMSPQHKALNPEIVTPIPRGHRHNVSESLQKEIDDAEYHLEEDLDKQPKAGTETRAAKISSDSWRPRRESIVDELNTRDLDTATIKVQEEAAKVSPSGKSGSVVEKLQDKSREVGLAKHDDFNDDDRTNPSDLDTNPSLTGTPSRNGFPTKEGHIRSISTSSNPWQELKPESGSFDEGFTGPSKHEPKTSISKLNVGAKEFKFDPTHSFAPGNFSFSGNNFQPKHIKSSPSIQVNHAAHDSIASVGSLGSTNSKLNVAAPAFNPISASKGNRVPSGNFDFSTPSFHPDAKPFVPAAFKSAAAPAQKPSKIFSYNPAEAIKPAKKSKAIPIVRPDTSEKQVEPEEERFDCDGHAIAPESRQKRSRQARAGDDDVPQFAMPSHPLTETGQAIVSERESSAAPFGKENAVPASQKAGPQQQREKITVKPPIGPNRRSYLEESPDYEGKGWPAFEDVPDSALQKSSPVLDDKSSNTSFKKLDDSEADMRELKITQTDLLAELGAQELDPKPVQEIKETPQQQKAETAAAVVEEPKPRPALSAAAKPFNMLSAEAKPFEFKPKASAVIASQPSPEPATQRAPDVASVAPAKAVAPPQDLGLGASRFAATPTPPAQEKIASPPAESPTKPSPVQLGQTDYDQHSFNDIDAVMQQLNRDDSDIGVERNADVWGHGPPSRKVEELSSPAHPQPDQLIRSDAPSPSTKQVDRFQTRLPPPQGPRPLSVDIDSASLDLRLGRAFESPIHQLGTPGEHPASDWDDFISSGEDEKLRTRGHHIGGNVDELVEDVMGRRLAPMEAALAIIQKSLVTLTSAQGPVREERSRSSKVVDSDADDEDDEVPPGFLPRSKSPRKDRKLDLIRTVVSEAIAAAPPTPGLAGDIAAAVEEALANTQTSRSLVGPSTDETHLRIAALESMLKESELRAEEELRVRRAAEDAVAENVRLLRISQTEEGRLRELSTSYENKLRTQDDKRQQSHAQTQMRMTVLEGAQENLQKTVSDLSAKNAYLDAAARDSRISEDKLRATADHAERENQELRRSLDSFRSRMEESTKLRTGLDTKFDRLQDAMAAADRELAQERDATRQKELEFLSRHETLSARLEAEARTRERLEQEMERLEGQEQEAMKARFQMEQIQKSHEHLDGLVRNLRAQHHDSQSKAAKFERDFHNAREAGHSELQRSRVVFQAEIDSANQQVNLVRASLENQLALVRGDAQRFKSEADAAHSKIANMQRDMEEQKKVASTKANNARDADMKEQFRKYEYHLDSLRAQHDRNNQNAVEDRQRSEQHLMEQIGLSKAKTDHLQDKVSLLEEKLEVAKSAAAAAVAAAQKASDPAALSGPAQSVAKSAPPPSTLPEKISPQALRESILVLQEQLQEREQRIESLTTELSAIDATLPQKVHDLDTEITWLRELLAVRQSDLEDLVRQLSDDTYDPAAVRDAAIRLKANIQMELQERERLHSGGASRTFPSLGQIADYTSPRAKAAVLPLAAAWGNWRKARDASVSSVGNLADVITQPPQSTQSRLKSQRPKHDQQTPSKPSPAGSATSFLSGLMTPPSSSRVGGAGPAPSLDRRFSASSTTSSGPVQRSSKPEEARSDQQQAARQKRPASRGKHATLEPATPPLLSRGLYDGDADPVPELGLGFGDEGM
ncbi:MAG: hypothetical protein M1814_004508 [Vezdaea aestivalis]|nr:MAG: hypothetical protein M1814_004508 [Vezdaea aestivalis]